jgi:hypothetical protein
MSLNKRASKLLGIEEKNKPKQDLQTETMIIYQEKLKQNKEDTHLRENYNPPSTETSKLSLNSSSYRTQMANLRSRQM